MKKVLFINGPNLNLLGKREPSVYGTTTLEGINKNLIEIAKKLNVHVEFFQSNTEGLIIDAIHDAIEKYDYLIINPGAYTHYSIAIRDAIKASMIPTIEVHISNIHAREEFRKTSVIAPVCIGQISGLGAKGYEFALRTV